MNRRHLSIVTALVAMGVSRAASAQYTLWPEQEVAPVPSPPRERPSPPEPASPPHFGSANTVLVTGSGGVSTSSDNSAQAVATVDLDYFFRNHLSLGVELSGSTFSYRSDEIYAYGIGPRGGYAISLGHGVALYPALGLVYSAMKLSSRISTDTDPEHRGFTLSLDVPLLFTVAPGLVAGIGVAVREDLTNYKVDPVYQTDRPNIGGFLTFGGWLPLGETVAPEASAYSHTPI